MLQRTRFIETAVIVCAIAIVLSACRDSSTREDANSNAGPQAADPDANANTKTAIISIGSLRMSEPERYTATMRINAQTAGGQTAGSPLEMSILRRGADRRWTLNPGSSGEISYLEKSGLKYLIIPGRKLYAEVPPEMLGPRPAEWVTPTAIIERLLSKANFEKLDTELVDGRSAVKYLSAPDSQSSPSQSSLVYVDQETGLPLRSTMNISTGRGVVTIAAETHDIRLSAEPALFDVPMGTRKVSSEEVKQQVDAFAGGLRAIVAAVRPDARAHAPASSASGAGGASEASGQPRAAVPPPPPPGGPAAIVKPKNANSNRR